MDSPTQRRVPYSGSCHCGRIKYVAYLTLPPHGALQDPKLAQSLSERDRSAPRVRFYKCNCSTCHKMSLFHLRLADSPADFFLLQPLDLEADLGDYSNPTGSQERHRYFCCGCGVRCFSLYMGPGTAGKGLVEEVELEGLGGAGGAAGRQRVWRIPAEGWREDANGYLSINAYTIDQDQDGWDLRVLQDKGWIEWEDGKNETGEARFDYPHEGGMW